MTQLNTLHNTPNRYCRLAGLAYLLIIIFGVTGQMIIRQPMIDYADASLTASNILQNSTLWRIGVFGDIMMHVLDVPVMIILYSILKNVSKPLALTSLAFNMAQTAVLIANKLMMLIPLLAMNNPYISAAFTSDQVNAFVFVLLDIHEHGFGIGLILFGFACIGYGTLIYRSKFFPKFLGIFMQLAGISYLINSFALLLAPHLSGHTFNLLLLSFIGELSFTLWLIFRGVDIPKWEIARNSTADTKQP